MSANEKRSPSDTRQTNVALAGEASDREVLTLVAHIKYRAYNRIMAYNAFASTLYALAMNPNSSQAQANAKNAEADYDERAQLLNQTLRRYANELTQIKNLQFYQDNNNFYKRVVNWVNSNEQDIRAHATAPEYLKKFSGMGSLGSGRTAKLTGRFQATTRSACLIPQNFVSFPVLEHRECALRDPFWGKPNVSTTGRKVTTRWSCSFARKHPLTAAASPSGLRRGRP